MTASLAHPRFRVFALSLGLAVSVLLQASTSRSFEGFLCAGVEAEVLTQTVDRTVVRIGWPEGTIPFSGVFDFALAVPTDGPIQGRIVEVDAVPVDPPIDVAQEQIFEVQPPLRAREMWLREVRVFAVYTLANGVQMGAREAVLEFDHPAPPSVAALARAVGQFDSATPTEDFATGVVVNAAAARIYQRAAAIERRQRALPQVEDTFARSPRWLRVEVDTTGVYELDYAALRSALGAAVDLIDPSTLRIFGATNRLQPLMPETLPASWTADAGLVERPLLVEAAGSAFSAGDRILAYLPGAEGWADEFDPSADWLEYDDHRFAERIAYWLTWDEVGGSSSSFPGPPLRTATRDASPSGSAGVVRSNGRVRSHFEENIVPAFGVFRDDWAWRTLVPDGGQSSFRFTLEDVVADSTSWLHTQAHAVRLGSFVNQFAATYSINDVELTTFTWSATAQHNISTAPVMFRHRGLPLVDGSNVLLVEHVSGRDTRNRSPQWAMDSFDITWRRKLRLDSNGRLQFTIPAAEAVNERWRFDLLQPDGGLDGALVFDVTDPWSPVLLDPAEGRASDTVLQFEQDLVTGERRDFFVIDSDRIPAPLRLEQRRPRLLRAEVGPDGDGETWDMVILHPKSLTEPAQELRDLRRENLAGRSGARVTAVDLQDVYDQFGHGSKDPAAIRNYLKFLYELEPRLLYVVFFGDANRDAKGVLPVTDPDLCPTYVSTWWPANVDTGTYPFADDDWFVRFQDPIVQRQEVPVELPDVACGRLPVATLARARALVDHIRDYERTPPPGPWRNTILLAADDEFGAASDSWSESFHIDEAECIAERVFPAALDVDKLYLTEFDQPDAGRSKPAARQAMQRSWSDGRLIVHYIGHGSPEQLADENLFRIEDVASLRNDGRRPLFLAFSCDVSIFDDPTKTSMAESMVLREGGGAIATIAATQVTYVSQNNDLTEAFYSQLFLEPGQYQQPATRAARSTPLGLALLKAKWRGPDLLPGQTRLSNDAKYVLLGDPSLRLAAPEESVALSGSLADSITAGQRVTIGGDLGTTAASGSWYVEARESASTIHYLMIRPSSGAGDPPDTLGVIDYELEGSVFYEGRGDYQSGAFSAELRTPTLMNFGDRGRVRVIMSDGYDEYVGLAQPLRVAAGTLDSDDRVGPTISLEFEGGSRRVQPGSTLSAVFQDSSGINVLGTLPANSILLEFDGGGIAVDVTDRFELDPNSYTRGSLEVTLPDDISMGPHSLTLSAADMIGNVSTATLDFEVVPGGRTALASHAVFPNPMRDEARFVVEVFAPSQLRVDIDVEVFTTRGQRLRTLSGGVDGGGRAIIAWDGRDEFGDEIANGTYLYVVRAHFPTTPARTETATGRIVLMR